MKNTLNRRAFLIGREYTEDYIDDEDGATAVEYGLLGALVGIALITGLRDLGKTAKAQKICTGYQVRYANTHRLGARWQKRCVAYFKRR